NPGISRVIARNSLTRTQPIALEMPGFLPELPPSYVPRTRESSLSPTHLAGRVPLETLRRLTAASWSWRPPGVQLVSVEAPQASPAAMAASVAHIPLRAPSMEVAPRQDFSSIAAKRTKARPPKESLRIPVTNPQHVAVEVCLPQRFS